MKINLDDKCVCVYISYMCRLCDNSLTQVSGAHYQQQIITCGANVSGLHRHIAADIEQTIFAGACKLLESLHVTKTCHLFTNISDLNDYVYIQMCIEK